MSRIAQKFSSLECPALIPFMAAGDPDLETSLEIIKALPAAGADIIEIGMPFTDPVADGSVIQEASLRALNNGADMKKTLQLVRDFRTHDQETPIVLMGYANPVFQYGYDSFSKDASNAGVDGIIVVDLPPEEAGDLQKALKANNIDLIRLITPTTDESRLKILLDGASGFLYYVSITGVTGAAVSDYNAVSKHISMIRQNTDLPVAIGFGIKTPDDAARMGNIADAVVVGSALVRHIEENDKGEACQTIEKHVSSLSKALVNLHKQSVA